MMWKSRWIDTEGIIISKLKGWMDEGGHYDVDMKGWIQKGALGCANKKDGWIRESIMMWK